MPDSHRAFTGLPPEGLEFLAGLAADNSKGFFEAHRATYESALLAPAKALVVALGEELRARVSPGIRAEPRVNGSILRINRDIRFSADKRPYKEHLDLVFWEGEAASRERPCFFLRLRPDGVGVGTGMRRFDPPVLEAYRRAVLDDVRGRALQQALGTALAVPQAQLGGVAYKRVPRSVAADHPRSPLLLHGGLFALADSGVPGEVFTAGFVGWAAGRMERMAPVQRWLTELLDAPA